MAPLSDVSIVELKTCPRCEESLPLSEFGICRARKDGLNLYCKRCIRQKIALSRAALREYKNARVKHGASSTDRSRLAIDAAGFSPRGLALGVRQGLNALADPFREIHALKASKAASACASGLTLLKIFLLLPFSSIRKVIR